MSSRKFSSVRVPSRYCCSMPPELTRLLTRYISRKGWKVSLKVSASRNARFKELFTSFTSSSCCSSRMSSEMGDPASTSILSTYWITSGLASSRITLSITCRKPPMTLVTSAWKSSAEGWYSKWAPRSSVTMISTLKTAGRDGLSGKSSSAALSAPSSAAGGGSRASAATVAPSSYRSTSSMPDIELDRRRCSVSHTM